jgi:hypothetical protein
VSDVLDHEDLFLVGASRRWARHGRGNLVERIAFAYQPYAIGVPFLRTLPLALDASMLVNQVAYVARKRRSGLLEAADLGLVRLYVGETIAGEVERNLIKRAASGRHSAQELFDAWRNQVLPRLRIVDTRGIQSENLDRIFRRGAPSDRPTALLSIVLGAELTLAEDPDLIAEKYAVLFSVKVHLWPAQRAGYFDITAHFSMVLSLEMISAASRALRAAIGRPGPGRNVTIAVVVVMLGVLGIALIKDARAVRTTAQRLAADGLAAFEQLYEFRTATARAIPQPIPATVDAPLWLRVARVLALAPAPLTATQVCAVASASTDKVERVLGEHRAFVCGPDGWQLGDW